MPVHSLHVFDRKGRTLYTKRYARLEAGERQPDEADLAEQRKLVFGMLFSLREITAALSPQGGSDENSAGAATTATEDRGLHSVRTGASTLYSYETASGMRFALYATNDGGKDGGDSGDKDDGERAQSVRKALSYIYNDLWITYVSRSPLYDPTSPNVDDTNFEYKVVEYLEKFPWFK